MVVPRQGGHPPLRLPHHAAPTGRPRRPEGSRSRQSLPLLLLSLRRHQIKGRRPSVSVHTYRPYSSLLVSYVGRSCDTPSTECHPPLPATLHKIWPLGLPRRTGQAGCPTSPP